MKACFVKSNGALIALVLLASLGTACQNSANVSNTNNGNTASTNTTTTTVTKNTTTASNANTETTANKPTTTSSSSGTADLHTPPDSSPERKAILDALREQQKSQSDLTIGKFDVESLKSHDGWAYIVTDSEAQDGEPYGMIEALLQEQGGRWKVVEVFEYDGDEKPAWAAFRARHRDAPDDIFPNK